MVQVGDRIASLTWELLLTTLFLAHRNKLSADAEVLLISPWISDVQNEQFALPTPLRDEVSNEVGRNLTSLSSVLQSLQKAGVAVKLMTHPLDGNWKREWSATAKERERNFLSRLQRGGVEIRMHNTNHGKIIMTPLGVLQGSANITENGFYKNQEQMELTLQSTSEFEQCVSISRDLYSSGLSYS